MEENTLDKKAELLKYRDLLLATIDYYLSNKLMQIKTADFDSDIHYEGLKNQTEEHFQNGRLSRLKQHFRDLTEPQLEVGDFKFGEYLQSKTNYDIDIFKSHYQQLEKVIVKGKIMSDSQFYDINNMVNQLCQAKLFDQEKIDILNRLLGDYEERKSRRTKRKNQET